MKPPKEPDKAPDWLILATELWKRHGDEVFADAPILDAYGRISINPDTGEMEKTDRQLLDVLQDIESRHARLGKCLRDDDKSAWNQTAKRPGWDELMERLESKEANGVIAWNVDRMMRQPMDLEKLIAFGNSGMLIGSTEGDYDLEKPNDRYTLRGLVSAAEKESAYTSKRLKRKFEATRKAGKQHGGPRPFGFQALTEKSTVPPEQVTTEKEAIIAACQAIVDGTGTLTGIADEWNERGLRTTLAGGVFTTAGVGAILRRARNAGLIEHDGAIVGKYENFEPVVSVEMWHQVRAVFASRRRGRPVNRNFLLSTLLYCGNCGHTLGGSVNIHASHEGGPPRKSYSCPYQLGCASVAITADPVDEWAKRQTISVLADPKHARSVARKSAALAKVDSALSHTESLALALSGRLGRQEISLERYDAAVAPLDKKIEKLTAERKALVGKGAGTTSKILDAAELATEWSAMTIEQRRAAVREAMPYGIRVAKAWKRGPGVDPTERLLILTCPISEM